MKNEKDTKRFIAYMLMHKHFKLVKKGANWRIEYNGVLLQPDDIEFLKLIAKKRRPKNLTAWTKQLTLINCLFPFKTKIVKMEYYTAIIFL